MDTTRVKSIFQSKVFWGAMLAALSVVFPQIYANLGIGDATQTVEKIVGSFGALLAIYGRFQANSSVTWSGK